VFPCIELLPNSVVDDLILPFFALLLIAYSLGANTDGRRLVAGLAMLLGAGALAILLDEPPGGADDFLFLATIIVGGPVLLGRLVHDRAELGRALRAKTAALDADRAARSAAAVSEERARIADELHEMVSRALASMVDRSDSAERLSRTDPTAAAAALEAIETTGRARRDPAAARSAAARGRRGGPRAAPFAHAPGRPGRAGARRRAAGRAARRGRRTRAAGGDRPDGVPRRAGGARRGT
jgi:hypothetical protein